MGFDQMMIFYDHFVVMKSTLTATFINTATNNYSKVFIRVDGNNVTIPSSEDLSELGGNLYDILTVQGSTGAVKSLTMSVDIAKFHGQNPSAMTATESLVGSATSSPSDGVYFHMTQFSPIGTTVAVQVQFVLEFEAIFFEPRTPGASSLFLSSPASVAFKQHQMRKQIEQKDPFGVTPKGYPSV